MLMITRTDTTIELARAGTVTVCIDVARVSGVMLAAERMPCGRICHALLLMTGKGHDPIRIDGTAAELIELHHYVVETMLCDPDGEPGSRPRMSVH